MASAHDPDPPAPSESAPSTGLLPWIVCGLGGLFFGFGYFQRVAPSAMIPELMRDFGASAAALGNLAALYFYAYALLEVPGGVMLDRFGPRRCLAGAITVCALGTLLFSIAGGIAWAYAGRVLIGAGAGFAWIGAAKLASMWFPPRRFALVTGVCSLLGMVGAVGAQAPLAALVEVSGWRAALIGSAGAGGLLAAAIWLVARDDVAPQRTARAAGGVLRGLGRVLASSQVWVTACGGALLVPNVSAFASLWGVPYMMQAHDVERPAAAAATSLVLIGFGGGSPLIGWWSDRIGRRRPPMLTCGSAALASMAMLVYVPGLPLTAVYVLCLTCGLGSSAYFLAYATSREHGPNDAVGATLGVVNMTYMLVGAAFQPLIGWLLDIGWDGRLEAGARVYSVAVYQMAFLSLIASQCLALVAMLCIRETHCRPSGER